MFYIEYLILLDHNVLFSLVNSDTLISFIYLFNHMLLHNSILNLTIYFMIYLVNLAWIHFQTNEIIPMSWLELTNKIFRSNKLIQENPSLSNPTRSILTQRRLSFKLPLVTKWDQLILVPCQIPLVTKWTQLKLIMWCLS